MSDYCTETCSIIFELSQFYYSGPMLHCIILKGLGLESQQSVMAMEILSRLHRLRFFISPRYQKTLSNSFDVIAHGNCSFANAYNQPLFSTSQPSCTIAPRRGKLRCSRQGDVVKLPRYLGTVHRGGLLACLLITMQVFIHMLIHACRVANRE